MALSYFLPLHPLINAIVIQKNNSIDMGKKRLILGLLFVLLTGLQTIVAQSLSITGKVEGDGEPLVGATVAIKGQPQNGAITNANGEYSLQAAASDVLVVSYIGYQTKEVSIGGKNRVDISLTSDAEALDEVVITIPYGTTKKSTFTGSVGYVDSKVIDKELVSNVSKALQGTVPGLQSFSSTGQPGSDASIYIRGVGSVNASSTPLYVVDGVPYEGSISSISPQDIESITVLKDAASAALYGSRAANGVIMIVTRQGKQDQPATVQLSAKYGWSSRARDDYKQLTTDQYYQLYWEAIRNQRLDSGNSLADANSFASANLTGQLGINPYGTAYPQPVGTDGKLVAGATALWNDNWDDALTQNAHFQQYDLSVTGGGRTSQYFLSRVISTTRVPTSSRASSVIPSAPTSPRR
jgi:TonB-dependent SusC/RagA subfamily outer membrane receptor